MVNKSFFFIYFKYTCITHQAFLFHGYQKIVQLEQSEKYQVQKGTCVSLNSHTKKILKCWAILRNVSVEYELQGNHW